MIRLAIPSIEADDLEAVREALASGFLVQGSRVAEFEQLVAERTGCAHAVAVSNCTAALHLSLLALRVGPGDRVAVAAFSWPATGNVVVLAGAEPIFIDIDPTTYNLNPDSLERVLRHTPVKAIIVVHAFGGMADMPRINEIAEYHDVPVIEDAACAIGAALHGRPAGAWGAAGCFSFHPRKAVTTGEGGVITTDDPQIARLARILRNHGIDPDSPAPDFVAAGYNFRMTEFQAALGYTQMAKLDRIIEARRAAAGRYDQLLHDTTISRPTSCVGSVHVYQSYVALLPHDTKMPRAEIIHHMRAAGIETTIGTYHIPLTSYFRTHGSYHPGMFPSTDDVAARAISLPLYEGITENEQAVVTDKLLALI